MQQDVRIFLFSVMKSVQKGNFDVCNVNVWILLRYAACRVGSNLHICHFAARGRLFPCFYSPNGFDINLFFCGCEALKGLWFINT